MTKETPVAQAHISLIHLGMAQISQNTGQLVAIGRITDEQHKDLIKSLDNLGEAIGNALHPRSD